MIDCDLGASYTYFYKGTLMRIHATRYMKVTLGARYIAFWLQMTIALLVCTSIY